MPLTPSNLPWNSTLESVGSSFFTFWKHRPRKSGSYLSSITYANPCAYIDGHDMGLFHRPWVLLLEQTLAIISLWLNTIEIARKARQDPLPPYARTLQAYFSHGIDLGNNANDEESNTVISFVRSSISDTAKVDLEFDLTSDYMSKMDDNSIGEMGTYPHSKRKERSTDISELDLTEERYTGIYFLRKFLWYFIW